MSDSFGLPGIFDNVRDGLVLVRFPEGRIVLFNRSASQMCGLAADRALGRDFAGIFTDPPVQARARAASLQPVGAWPGHEQVVLRTTLHTKRHAAAEENALELHFCRVEDAGTGGPLVLLVIRPDAETTLAQAIRKAGRSRSAARTASVQPA